MTSAYHVLYVAWNLTCFIVDRSPSIKLIGTIARFTRLLWMSLLVTAVLPSAASADIKTSIANVSSSDMVISKRSYHEFLTSTASARCFSNGCGDNNNYPAYAMCNPGAYIYQITGYSGTSSLVYTTAAVNRFDIVCSDGGNYSIGQLARTQYGSTTIINPNGYTALLVGGGCVTYHIQIGGTDFGDAGYPSALSACQCPTGLTFVGFNGVSYGPDWPSFQNMIIQCDKACPKGTYYSGGSCYPCAQGFECIHCLCVVIYLE